MEICCLLRILLILVASSQYWPCSTAQNTSRMRQVPAVLVFGDSIVDPGNNNNLQTQVKSNFPPYGKDFAGQTPSGRFSNGKIPGDLIASRLGVKEYLPPYMGQLGPEDILTGVSFASGGAGFDPVTSNLVNVISMQEQLNLFRQYTGRLYSVAGIARGREILSESLFVIVAGTDDFANTYFGSNSERRRRFSLPSYVHYVSDLAASFIRELGALGARRIAFVGVPPIGCLPSQRTLGGGPVRACERLRDEASRMYNERMGEIINDRGFSRDVFRVQFLDMYPVLLDMIMNPSVYGFQEVTRGCCGTGEFEVTIFCNRFTAVCDDDSKYLFWDSFHPTQKAYQIIVDQLLDEIELL